MNTDEYIKEKKDQLEHWEKTVEARVRDASRAQTWKAKRDEVMKKLETLREDTSERWDVVRMGFESAWDELKAAFETATGDLHPKGS